MYSTGEFHVYVNMDIRRDGAQPETEERREREERNRGERERIEREDRNRET